MWTLRPAQKDRGGRQGRLDLVGRPTSPARRMSPALILVLGRSGRPAGGRWMHRLGEEAMPAGAQTLVVCVLTPPAEMENALVLTAAIVGPHPRPGWGRLGRSGAVWRS